MRVRLVAFALVTASAAAHLGFTLPARQTAIAAEEGYRRARDERRVLGQRLAAAERRALAGQRLRAVLAAGRFEPRDAVAQVRRDAIAAVRESGVTRVRLAVTQGRLPAAAALSLSAEGSLSAVSALAASLPATRAVVLESARLDARDDLVGIQLEGLRPGGGP